MSTPSRVIPKTAGETSPEAPWPLRLLTSKLTEYLSRSPAVWLEAQVVQVTRRPGQGTVYLTLRDTDVDMSFSATVAAKVLDGLASPLVDGSHVVVHARAQLFPRRGSLSLAVDAIRPVGVGELLARIEQLRRVLAGEGLFDSDRKRALPFVPRVVGLVCGRASAAEHDVVENARKRWPAVQFDIRNVAVQGPNAVTEVCEAMTALEREPEVDVIIVTRGGGSLEDLLPFSNEAMIRTAAACFTPIVSAIGHESDSPLLDLVADVRASTPTDAARRVVPDVAAERAGVQGARERLHQVITRRLDREQEQLSMLREREVMVYPELMIDWRAEEITQARERATRAFGHRIERARDDVHHLRQRVAALSPAATLERGYAVVQLADGPDVGAVVRHPDQARGHRLRVRVARGEFTAESSAASPVAN